MGVILHTNDEEWMAAYNSLGEGSQRMASDVPQVALTLEEVAIANALGISELDMVRQKLKDANEDAQGREDAKRIEKELRG